MSLQVGVLGATGTTGAELLRYLVGHPEAEIAYLGSSSQAGAAIDRVHPQLAGHLAARLAPAEDVPELDVLFTATPHGTSAGRMDELLESADLVVDLSSDFRLADPEVYEATYGRQHPAPELLSEAAYGLPEITDATRLSKARIIAGPGCLATASQLALAPLARAGLLGDEPVVLDGKIGSTAGGAGGGRWSTHAARTGTVRPYAPTGHRHEAEIVQNLFGGRGPSLWFSAHAVDMPRGILMTAHVPLTEEVGRRQLHRALLEAYGRRPFVDVLPGRAGPGGVPEPRFVAGTNRAQVAALARPGEAAAVVLCAIDNLGKGAAGSAIQSMNLHLGLDETAGLSGVAAFP